jgi:LCP family protein required for cell wall assembly
MYATPVQRQRGRVARPQSARTAEIAAPVKPESLRQTAPVEQSRPVASPPAAGTNYEPWPLPPYQAKTRPLRPVRRSLRWRRRLLRTGGVALGILLVTGGFLSWKAYVQLHKVFHGTTTVAALSGKPVAPALLKGEGDGRVNILLLGIGGPTHEGPDLTDTIVVLSVDPVNHKAAFLSLPRDLWVKMPVNYFGQYQKINAAYESGKYRYLGKMDSSNANANAVEAGFSSIDQAVGEVLGININYHMLVNFQAFQQAINTVDGVTVNVQEPLYDPTMAWENGNNPVLATAGVQTMDGKRALLYARSRETSSDFARAQRQRQILVALKDKVLSTGTLSNPAKIDGLMNAFGDNVYSDLSTQGAERLYSIMKTIDDTHIRSIDLTQPPNNLVTTDHVGNVSVVRPRAGFNDYGAIQAFVRSQLVDGYLLKEHANVAVVGSTEAGAEAAATDLTSYGYTVKTTATGATASGQTAVIDLSGGEYPYTRNYLEKHFDVRASDRLPAGFALPSAATSAKFVIIVHK